MTMRKKFNWSQYYQDKLFRGECKLCKSTAIPDSPYCSYHRVYQRALEKDYKQRRRDQTKDVISHQQQTKIR